MLGKQKNFKRRHFPMRFFNSRTDGHVGSFLGHCCINRRFRSLLGLFHRPLLSRD